MSNQEKVIRLIEQQQVSVKQYSAQWAVGEQLKDICRRDERSAQLLARDLEMESMSITEAEKKIKAFADAHRSGNSACVPPMEAERILREFYGLHSAQSAAAQQTSTRPAGMLNLADFL